MLLCAPWPHWVYTSFPNIILRLRGGTVNHDVLGVFRELSRTASVCKKERERERERERARERKRESPLTTWINPLMLTGLDTNNVAFHSPHPPLRSWARTHTYSVSLSLCYFLCSLHSLFYCRVFVPIHKKKEEWHFSWKEKRECKRKRIEWNTNKECIRFGERCSFCFFPAEQMKLSDPVQSSAENYIVNSRETKGYLAEYRGDLNGSGPEGPIIRQWIS